MKKYLTRKERLEHVKKWREGGMSKNAYALSAGLCPRTFMGWTWQEPGKKDTGFIEIPKESIAGNFNEILIEKGSIYIRVPMSVGLQELQTVLKALGGVQ